MNPAGRILLVNPRITSGHKARFPLSLLTLAAGLDGRATHIVDGNITRDCTDAVLHAMSAKRFDAVGVTVMGGPQVASAIAVSQAVRHSFADTPIVWGGYFPTLYPEAALNAPYVDYAVRGQGEAPLRKLLDRLAQDPTADLSSIDGLSWKSHDAPIHNPDARFSPTFLGSRLPYELLGDPRRYLVPTFMGRRTAAHQAALGCRFRCTFCGVAGMFRGATALPPADRLESDLLFLKNQLGADSIQFYDHNFFDREADMAPLLEVLARQEMPWWCYARADALLNLSERSWERVRKSRLRMAYIGAESPSDALLKSVRKGTRSNQTLEVAALCAKQGIIPELSFMVAPPEDPEGETERTFEFIHKLKRINPRSEIIVYIYTPVPTLSTSPGHAVKRPTPPLVDVDGSPVVFPTSPEQWTEPRWVDYACHADAPWLTDKLRRRIRDFVTVLGCRFPTVQDARTPPWAKAALRALASWRYKYRRYDHPWELGLSRKLVRLSNPQATSL